ncbi:DUF202 domain-containing protein [Ancylobacter sp. MQZ15Z-1]|uniref:DUF202 domain-containing protein n=1 Tax=Ancylobacter mangrovi TaxID=2972472 RepID=A0A9X2T6L1_9HYPH|nr:DUF202 domain-containing protein [Ancylobacter mangrovi]MCS0496494.1 DUF202 domain-containing protein [Ancylobacter mangrovi]
MTRSVHPQERSRWWERGIRPDYRFSLANERTFLAWIRTALALIAGATAVDQFASHLGPAHLRLALSLVLFCAGGWLGAMAYTRWERAEQAMRHEADLPRSRLLPVLSAFTAFLAVGLALLVMVG